MCAGLVASFIKPAGILVHFLALAGSNLKIHITRLEKKGLIPFSFSKSA
jgi:DNA-binding MarR family transcriptional regulator